MRQGVDLRLKHQALRVEYGSDQGGVRVTALCPEGKEITVEAKYCVITVPLGVSRIEVFPEEEQKRLLQKQENLTDMCVILFAHLSLLRDLDEVLDLEVMMNRSHQKRTLFR